MLALSPLNTSMTKKRSALWRKVKKTVATVWNVPGVEGLALAFLTKLAVRVGISGAAVALAIEVTKAVS